MPYLSPNACNNNMGTWTAASSKYLISIYPQEPGCTASMANGFSLIADFMGDRWYGTSDGMEVQLSYIGIVSGFPVWLVTFTQADCASASQALQSTCPPGPFTFAFSPLNSICCPSNPNGYSLVGGGFTDSTGGCIDLAPCPECPTGPNVPNTSNQPIRYATGEVILRSDELPVRGYGMSWGQERRIATRQSLSVPGMPIPVS